MAPLADATRGDVERGPSTLRDAAYQRRLAADYRSRRLAGERARWLSAVLLLTSIAAISAIVGQWPQRARVAAPTSSGMHDPRPLLIAESLRVFDAPTLPRRGAVSAIERIAMPAPQTSLATIDTPIAPRDATIAEVRAPYVPSAVVDEAVAPLASRRLAILASPRIPAAEPEVAIDPAAPAYTFVELPAVAVGRVVVVAGRGIKTGIRATRALFRAPF